MNWKAIFGLSLFGFAMAIGTVFVISPKIEPLFWLVIFIVCAFVLARQAAGRPFLHGLLLGIVNSVWVTGAHLIFFNRYVANHAQEAAMMQRASANISGHMLMLLVGAVIGVVSGAVIGVMAYGVSKLVKSAPVAASPKVSR